MDNLLMLKGAEKHSMPPNLTKPTSSCLEIYQEVEGSGFLALDAIDGDLAVIEKAEEIRIATSCGTFGLDAGPYLFCVAIWTPDEYRAEFLDWYESEHFPMLVECREWDGGRLVEGPAETGNQFYALHNLTTPKALDSDERKASRSTQWFNDLAQNDWFDSGFVRTLYARAG